MILKETKNLVKKSTVGIALPCSDITICPPKISGQCLPNLLINNYPKPKYHCWTLAIKIPTNFTLYSNLSSFNLFINSSSEIFSTRDDGSYRNRFWICLPSWSAVVNLNFKQDIVVTITRMEYCGHQHYRQWSWNVPAIHCVRDYTWWIWIKTWYYGVMVERFDS